MFHMLWEAAHDHVVVAVTASGNAVLGVFLGVAGVTGAEVNDGLLTGAVLFILATGVSIAGWGLVLLVRLSQVVSRLEGDRDDHERRLGRLEGK